MKNVYISLPYSHENNFVREYRFRQCVEHALTIALTGNNVISPVLACHPVYNAAKAAGISDKIPYEFWIQMSERAMAQADLIHLLKLEGWDQSTGVRHELNWAAEHNIQVVEYTNFRR